MPLLTRLLGNLLRRTSARQSTGADLSDVIDEQCFSRTWRESEQAPELLVAHARWQMQRDPLLAAELLQEAARRMVTASLPLRLLGELHLELGNAQSAAESFHAALLRDEFDQLAWQGLARARTTQGRVVEALYAKARGLAETDDRRSASTEFRGVNLPVTEDWESWQKFLKEGETAETPSAIEKALEKHVADFPAQTSPRIALSLWLSDHGRPRAALPYAQEAHRRSPEDPAAGLALATVFCALGEVPQALDVCRHALARQPDNLELRTLYADCLGAAGENAAAIDQYEEILAIHPAPGAKLLNNYGYTLALMENFGAAITPLRTALALEPKLQKARLNLAYALTYHGRRTEARQLLEAIIGDEPHHFEAHWFRSHLLLASHDFPAGWADYRYRFVAAATSTRPMPLPRWNGRTLSPEESLLITAEQGLGDEIMFGGCLADLAERAPRITLECDPRLLSLFSRSFPHLSLQPRPTTNAELPPPADYYLPAGDLPSFFRRSPEPFRNNRQSFLVPDHVLSETFRQRLAALGHGLKIGIAWRGGSPSSRQSTRSLPLPDWSPLLSVAGCRFVSLQYGASAEEIAALQSTARPVTHWPEAIEDLDAFAALISALDLVITVCSAPVHFAGGLGRPAWVLAPHAPEWRYSELDGHMLWYSSVRMFRQPAPGDWASVIRQVHEQLIVLAADDRQRP